MPVSFQAESNISEMLITVSFIFISFPDEDNANVVNVDYIEIDLDTDKGLTWTME